MANSLMELYGGGITGEPTSYYTGGAVSRAKIASKYRGDYNKVKAASEENAKNMSFWSNLGNIGGFVADLFLPGSGGVVRAGAESFYRPEEVGDIDFALGQEEQVSNISDAYRKGIIGRGAMSSLSSMLMPEIYKDLGEKAKVGLGKLGSSKVGQSIPMDILGEKAATEYGVGGKDFAKQVSEGAYQDMPWLKDREAFLTTTPSEKNLMDFLPQTAELPPALSSLPGDINPQEDLFMQYIEGLGGMPGSGSGYNSLYREEGGMIPKMPQGGYVNESYTPPINPATSSNPYGFNMNASNGANQYGVNTDALSNLASSGWNMGNVTGGALFGAGSELQGIVSVPNNLFTPGGGTTNTTSTTGATGTFNPYGDYGKQRGVAGALEAAGMGDKMQDPEFAKYMKYLPTFDMGYEQKIADYRTGAQDSLFGMTAPMGPSETTFSGSGAAKKLRETSRKKTTDIYGRQERGVGEDYIKDVLAGLTAAETARGSVFEAPDGSDGKVDPPADPARRDILNQTKVHNGRNWEWNGYEWVDNGAAG